MWIWVVLAISIVAIVISIAVIIWSSRKNDSLGVADIERGFRRYKKHITKTNQEIDKKLEDSETRLKALNEKALKVAKELKENHEKINDANNWDDLNDAARDIESR